MASKEALYQAGLNKLLSVAGQLQQAVTVVRPGRAFLQQLFDSTATVRKPHHHLSLNKGARSLWAGQAIGFDTVMWWAACCIAFFFFLLFRMGELTSPTFRSHGPVDCMYVEGCGCRWPQQSIASQDSPAKIKGRSGRRVNIYLGRTDEDLCPVAALLAYLAVCGMEPGPLFELSNGHF